MTLAMAQLTVACWDGKEEAPPWKKRPRPSPAKGRSRRVAYFNTVVSRTALMAASPLRRPVSRAWSSCVRWPQRNIPPPAPTKAASPALEAVEAWDTVVGLVGTCRSAAVSMASKPAPAKLAGATQRHCALVKRNGAVQKSFWSRRRLRGRDFKLGDDSGGCSSRFGAAGGGGPLAGVCACVNELTPIKVASRQCLPTAVRRCRLALGAWTAVPANSISHP